MKKFMQTVDDNYYEKDGKMVLFSLSTSNNALCWAKFVLVSTPLPPPKKKKMFWDETHYDIRTLLTFESEPRRVH